MELQAIKANLMRRLTPYLLFLTFCFVFSNATSQKVYSITIKSTINPATSGFIERAINKATEQNAACLIIELNTPGGLLSSTRDITGNILNAKIPVIVYVSPAGGHAGSAGVFVTMAAHIAAMAPGTNIGAAHPVAMQGSMDTAMNEKATNDAAAFIRTIAQKRNRNAEWAEEAVRKSVSLTATEALRNNVIDIVAFDIPHLLQQINGRSIELNSRQEVLNVANARTEKIEMSFIEKLLNILSDPNIAYILLMIGFYGILFEFYSPGAIFPGILGVLGLILGFYSLNTLPLNYAGLALIIFSIILFVLEIKVTSYGMLAIGGIVSLALGSAMLIRPDSTFEIPGISRSVIITTTAVTAAFFLFVIGMGLKAQRAKPVIGPESIAGETGSTLEVLDPVGNVLVHGELWQAESTSGVIKAGEKIRVTGRKNFKLFVESIKPEI